MPNLPKTNLENQHNSIKNSGRYSLEIGKLIENLHGKAKVENSKNYFELKGQS